MGHGEWRWAPRKGHLTLGGEPRGGTESQLWRQRGQQRGEWQEQAIHHAVPVSQSARWWCLVKPRNLGSGGQVPPALPRRLMETAPFRQAGTCPVLGTGSPAAGSPACRGSPDACCSPPQGRGKRGRPRAGRAGTGRLWSDLAGWTGSHWNLLSHTHCNSPVRGQQCSPASMATVPGQREPLRPALWVKGQTGGLRPGAPPPAESGWQLFTELPVPAAQGWGLRGRAFPVSSSFIHSANIY